MKEILYFFIGVAGGAIGGMGMGGGTVLIPLLSLFSDFTQKQAQAVNLAGFLPMSVVALVVHAKCGRVEFRRALPLIFPGVLFGAAGAFLMRKASDRLLKKCFGTFLLLLAIFSAADKIAKRGKKTSFYAPKGGTGEKK